MRKIIRTTTLPAPVDRVWDLVQRPDTLLFVSWPVLVFTPVDGPFPEVWEEQDYEVSMRFLGVMPVGRQHVVIRHEPGNEGVYRIRDAGYGALVTTWDHLITVESIGNQTRYTDDVTIEASWLTWPIAVFATLFYAHRQRRWRRLLRSR